MHGRALVAAMSAAQVGALLPHVTLPAVMPGHLIPLWGLSNSDAGLMSAAYALGYMFAVPALTLLTDRIDARRILAAGAAATALATLAFAAFAQGLWSAALLWGLAGAGYAGAYMPGLRALTDRLEGADPSRSVTLYTASFSLGVGISYLVAQLIAERWGWRAAFVVTGFGPLAMLAVALALRPVPPPPGHRKLLDLRPALANRAALGYSLAYGAHCFELYGLRTWIVAFWGFVVAQHGAEVPLGPVAVSTAFTLLALPCSVLGNEAALRFGRHRAISWVMLASAGVAAAIGLTAGGTPWVTLALLAAYAFTVPADSGALTSGASGAAAPQSRGATLALHSAIGFGLSALGGWAVGFALDTAGGAQSASGWTAAFLVLGAGVALGPLALRWARRG